MADPEPIEDENDPWECTECGDAEARTYYLCDQNDNAVYCGKCYDKSICANNHSEGCGTMVMVGD